MRCFVHYLVLSGRTFCQICNFIKIIFYLLNCPNLRHLLRLVWHVLLHWNTKPVMVTGLRLSLFMLTGGAVSLTGWPPESCHGNRFKAVTFYSDRFKAVTVYLDRRSCLFDRLTTRKLSCAHAHKLSFLCASGDHFADVEMYVHYLVKSSI